MVDDLEIRRRRALWRANHRGTKELDLLVGGYAEKHLDSMSEPELTQFEIFLMAQEPALQSALLCAQAPQDIEPELQGFVTAIRAFHGLPVVRVDAPSAPGNSTMPTAEDQE